MQLNCSKEDSEEERVRSVVSELIYSMDRDPFGDTSHDWNYHVWRSCVVSFNLIESNIIIERHFGGTWPILARDQFIALLSKMCIIQEREKNDPELLIAPDDLIEWLDGTLIPELYAQRNIHCIEICCEYLRAQALSLEFAFGAPFEPALLTILAVKTAEKYCPQLLTRKPSQIPFKRYGSDDSGKGIATITLCNLHNTLALQGAVWRTWDARPTCLDVINHGLDGLVRNRLLDLVTEPNITKTALSDEEYTAIVVDDIGNVIRPLVDQFRGSLDAMILVWINNILGNTFIVYSPVQAAVKLSTDKSVVVILYSRLVAITSAIKDPDLLASAVLTLWQMSTSSNAGSLGVDADAEADAALAHSLQRLAKIGLDVFPRVSSGRNKDALQESIRLLRLKAIAASYGISNFDVRNTRQLRGVVNIIATSYWVDRSITDCIEFAEAWNSISIDLPYILGRALIARVLVRERLSTSSDQIYDDVHPLEVLDKTKLLEDAFRSIPDHRQALATETAVSYLIDNLEDICAKISRGNASGAEITTLKEEASMACSGAVTLGHLLLDGLGSVRDAPKWAGFITTGLLSALKRIRFLQSDYNIYLSVSGLADPIVCLDVGRRLAENRTKDLIARRESGIASSNMHNGDKKISERRKDLHKISSNSTDSDLLSNYFMLPAKTRHACMLMNVSPVFVEYNVISLLTKEGKQAIALEVAKMLSFENIMDAKFSSDGSDDSSMTASTNAQLVLDAAIALCTLVARQVLSTVSASSKVDIAVVETFLLARSILQISSVTCNPEYLGGTLDLFSGCDLVVSVYDRFEAPANAAKAVKGKIASNTTSNVGTFQVSQHVSFSRDGILMSPDIALALLLKHVLKEVQRRGLTSVGAKSVNNSAADRGSSLYLEDFVNFLQKSENHILAVRSLLSSWCMFDGKAKALQISLLGLSRKILSYRDIDSCLGVACLASVSYDTMVRELKQAVPSIQSDFSRLQTVAVIGEDLSRLWSQEELLGVFQSLQTNAKWWHTLASHGIKIDPRAFQSSIASQREACIRAVVPELLSKSSLNLDLAIEYCCQFDVEGSYATLCYIEQLLLGSSISPSELHWMKLVNQASSTVGEAALAGLYRRILKKINPLDYEKIRFVSLWLIQAISEDPSLQDNIKDELPDVAMCRYNRYVDIITFLAGVSFQLSGADLTPAYVSVYENLSASSPYQHRLPLWMLVDDTWGVLGPIMSSVPELCPKLTLLCGPLAINPDIFHSKRVMASTSLFPRVASSEVTASCNNISKKSNEVDMAITSGRVLAVERLKDFQDNIQCIEDHRLRIEIWQWAYRREKESKNWFVAEIILGAALDDTGNLRKFHAADNTLILNNLKELRGEMLLDMVRLKCRRVLISLVDEKRRDSDADLSVQAIDEMVYGLSLSEANNMDRILRHLLEWAIEISWEMQLFRMQGNTASGNSRGSATSSALCIWDITITRFFPAVLTFFNRVAAAAKKMMPYCAKLDKHIKGDGVEEDKSASSLEAIRHFFITKLLADGLTAYPLSEKGSSLASAVSEETSSDATSGKSAKSNSAAGWAGLLGVSESLVSPTAAASRRRGDLFCAFSIAVLVGCCSSLDQRKLYYDQLQTLAKSNGKSGKARRFTSRSKFRAIQALRFFPSCENVVFNSNDNNNIISYVWTPEDNDLWRFLFCISELQELRLPCSEETLGESIGVSLTDHQPIITPSGMPGIHDPRLLIRTLLRDEGHQTEVSELCRDILLCSMSSQTGHDIWIDLIVHMEMNGHHRCLLDTMLILRHYQGSEIRGPLCNDAVGSIAISLSEVCGGDLACALVRVLNIFTVECAEKIEQVIMLLRNRNKVDTSELHSKKNQSTVASTVSECSLALNKGRVVLRNVVEGCAWGISEWEEAPEDLILCLEHLSVLWAMLSKYCASSAFDQLKHSEEPSAQISGDVGGCTRNLLVSSFKIIIGAAFDWLNFNFGTARDVTTKINFSSLLDICLRKRMGFAAAAVYSRIMQSCLSCMSSCLHTLTKICCGFQTDYLGGTVIRRTDAVASEVLKMAFDHIARNVMCPISAIDSVAVITEHSNIFSWIQIDDSIHWPWMLIGAGFRTLSSGSVFSFLDERCILPENVEFLRVLLSAAANSWWQTVSTVDTPVSRSSCNSTTTKDSQALLQWCLSR